MLENLLDRVARLKESFAKDAASIWFRGHKVSSWQLKSTLHRHVEALTGNLEPPMPPEKRVEGLREEAKSIYRQFKNDAWPLLRPEERSEWGILFAMQHYKLPTRLLDWTESFACALFFAQQARRPGDAAAIWVLKPERLNEISLQRRGLVALDDGEHGNVQTTRWHPRWAAPSEGLNSIAVAPLFTNPRMTAQRAAFTLNGDSFAPLEEQFEGKLVHEGALVKIELPADASDAVDEYLDLMGLTAFSFYPDLEGLALKHEARVAKVLKLARKFYPHQMKPDPSA